jgi:hypothetical protein
MKIIMGVINIFQINILKTVPAGSINLGKKCSIPFYFFYLNKTSHTSITLKF